MAPRPNLTIGFPIPWRAHSLDSLAHIFPNPVGGKNRGREDIGLRDSPGLTAQLARAHFADQS